MNYVLVTGGAGYVGSHTCKALSEAGYTPVVFDNLVNGHKDFVKWGPFEFGDIRDREALASVIRKYSPAAVMHFAAFAYVGESVTDPIKYYENNVCGSLALLRVMAETGMNNIVFSSSCATYGFPDTIPINEDTLQNPINPYGRTKLIVEQLLGDFESAGGPTWIALRYFNAAGADAELEIGERHNPETHLIPLALSAIDGDELKVFGSDFDTNDGTCVRDFVHVSDLAIAHVKALRALENGSPSNALNLGTGRGYSVIEIIEVIQRVAGRSVKYRFVPSRKGDPPVLVSNPGFAQDLLKWQPESSDLENIVDTAWRWFQIDSRCRQTLT